MRSSRAGSVNQRFFSRFIVDNKSKCWEWSGGTDKFGYGKIGGILNGQPCVPRQMLAHRVSWIIHYGEIPEGEGAHGTVVMHICDNPGCVNPKHLRLGTQSDNVKDMDAKFRHVSGEWQTRKGVDHFRSAFKDQADIDLICATIRQTKALAEKYGVDVCTIKRIRLRNGIKGADVAKFAPKAPTQEVIDFIRSTPPGTRGLAKRFGLGKTTVANIRNFLTHAK